MISIEFIESGTLLDHELTYVVLGAMFRDQWIFVRHRDRQSWEMPAGHIESGEPAHEAAARELREETGAITFSLKPLGDYSVTVHQKRKFGRLYFAKVEELANQLEYEIEELRYSTDLPSLLTYPEVQTLLFDRVKAYANQWS